MKRVLIFPNTNTLSHLARALAVADWLAADGYEPHLGVAASRLAWASHHRSACHPVPELWEPSGAPYPCPPWFWDAAYVGRCVQALEDLIRRLRPALVIAIFDFAARVSTRGVPLLTI